MRSLVVDIWDICALLETFKRLVSTAAESRACGVGELPVRAVGSEPALAAAGMRICCGVLLCASASQPPPTHTGKLHSLQKTSAGALSRHWQVVSLVPASCEGCRSQGIGFMSDAVRFPVKKPLGCMPSAALLVGLPRSLKSLPASRSFLPLEWLFFFVSSCLFKSGVLQLATE